MKVWNFADFHINFTIFASREFHNFCLKSRTFCLYHRVFFLFLFTNFYFKIQQNIRNRCCFFFFVLFVILLKSERLWDTTNLLWAIILYNLYVLFILFSLSSFQRSRVSCDLSTTLLLDVVMQTTTTTKEIHQQWRVFTCRHHHCLPHRVDDVALLHGDG